MIVRRKDQKQQDDSIDINDMADGSIARIVEWPLAGYEGRIVQRHGPDLITLGEGYDRSWPGFFKNTQGRLKLPERVMPMRVTRDGDRLHLEPADGSTPMRAMLDGAIGVVVQWVGGDQVYNGYVVQRNGNTLVTLNKPCGQSWPSIPQFDECRVRLLKRGDSLEL